MFTFFLVLRRLGRRAVGEVEGESWEEAAPVGRAARAVDARLWPPQQAGPHLKVAEDEKTAFKGCRISKEFIALSTCDLISLGRIAGRELSPPFSRELGGTKPVWFLFSPSS